MPPPIFINAILILMLYNNNIAYYKQYSIQPLINNLQSKK